MQRITGFIVLSLTLFLAGLTAVAWVHQEKAQQELMQMERDWCTANSQERCGTPRQTACRRLFGYWCSWDGDQGQHISGNERNEHGRDHMRGRQRQSAGVR